MKKWILSIIACPICKTHNLDCKITKEENNEIIDGKLICMDCKRIFDINQGIPRMISKDIVKKDIDTNLLEKHIQIRDANISFHDDCVDYYEKDISTDGLFTDFNQSRMENIIKDLSKKGEGEWFLDLGCGTGNCLKWGHSYNKHAIGVDVSMEMLKIAKDRGLEVIQADALFLPFASNVFNTTTAVSFLHHIYSQYPVLKEISRIIRKNGFLYSDWDPNKIFQKRKRQLLPGPLRTIIKLLFKPLIYSTQSVPTDYDYVKDINPSASELQKLAEYYHFTDEPGIDPICIINYLEELNFSNVEIKYHWMGRQLNQLPKMQRFFTRFFVALTSPNNNFAPLFSIIAKK